VRALVAELRIPGLRTYGVTAEDVPVLVEKAARASSMKSNPVALSAEQMAAILHAAI
jgi:alcohol dehydrogenase class IV